MYIYYNANVLNKHEEDCVIRSISCALDKSWDYVYEMLSDEAQAQGTMMNDRDFIIWYLDGRFRRIYDVSGSIGAISNKYKNNVLLITMNGHITCSKYGIIYDTFDCRNRKAEYVWVVN